MVQTFVRKHSKEKIPKKYSDSSSWVRKIALMYCKSRAKSYHWYKYKYTKGEELECIMEPENKQSSHAVSANTKEKEQKRTKNKKREEREKKRGDDCCESKAIGHIPDVLAEVVYELIIE